MNQTYLKANDSFESYETASCSIEQRKASTPNLLHLTRLAHENSKLTNKKVEFKLKLSKIRERTKLLLEKHNWKKFFVDGKLVSHDVTSTTANTMFQNDCQQSLDVFSDYHLSNTTILTDESSSQFLSTINLIKRDNNTQNKVSKLNLLDLNATNEKNNSIKKIKSMQPCISNVCSCSSLNKNKMKLSIIKTPLSAVKRKFQKLHESYCDEEDFDEMLTSEYNDNDNSNYRINLQSTRKFKLISSSKITTRDVKPTLKRQQQSLTFIADFASTSTPNRKTQQPITSTPKVSSHDPVKYHPTRTIRNKNKKVIKKDVKKKAHVSIKKRTSKKCSSELNIDLLRYNQQPVAKLHQQQQKPKTKLFIEPCLTCDCNKAAVMTAACHNFNFVKPSNKCNLVMDSQQFMSKKRKLATSNSSSFEHVNSSKSTGSCHENSYENCNLCNMSAIGVPRISLDKQQPRIQKNISNIRSKVNINRNDKRSSTRISSILATTNQTNLKNKKRVKKQPATTYELEISLQDLLYKPVKLRKLTTNNSADNCVMAKQQLTNAIATSSKVYYL